MLMEVKGDHSKYNTYKHAFAGKSYPLAFVDMDLLDENIAAILGRSKGKKIRVASKSVRCVSLLEYILKSDPQFQGIMSFTGAEAVFLSQKGFDDILVAYPEVNQLLLEEVAEEIKKGKTIVLMADRPEHLHQIDQVGKRHGIQMPVCIDIDMSVDFPGLHFGVWRSSVRNLKDLTALLDETDKLNNINIQGLMGYEAQIAGVADKVPGQGVLNTVIRMLKSRSISKIATFRKAAADMIRSRGYALNFINGGGTGSLETTSAEEAVSEVTVGSGFYNSHLFDHYQNFLHQPAAGFACVVNRHPKKDIYTCAGGGYVASGAIEPLKLPVPYLPAGTKLLKNEGAGEVQTPVFYKGNINIGDPVFFRHSKAGELCERFNHLHLVRNGQIEKIAPTYRGEGQCFL